MGVPDADQSYIQSRVLRFATQTTYGILYQKTTNSNDAAGSQLTIIGRNKLLCLLSTLSVVEQCIIVKEIRAAVRTVLRKDVDHEDAKSLQRPTRADDATTTETPRGSSGTSGFVFDAAAGDAQHVQPLLDSCGFRSSVVDIVVVVFVIVGSITAFLVPVVVGVGDKYVWIGGGNHL